METDGEGGGGGGEAERKGSSELGRLLEAIGSSEVPEKRIPLIRQLEEDLSADDLGLVLQGLLASWVDSTCSGVSHCTLHRSILQVALKCSDLDIADHLGQFFTLGAKASSWCAKHLQWSAKCIDQSQVVEEEEHNRLRQEVNLLSLNISTKLLDIAAKCITVLGLEVAEGEEGQGAAQEECVLNKADDLFPTLETMAVEVGPAPAHLLMGMSPDQEASRRCMHCGSEKTPRWLRGPDGPGTLCNACGQRFLKGFLPDPNRRRQGRPSTKGRPCIHCRSKMMPKWRRGANGQRSLKGPLLHSNPRRPSIKGRRCMHCASEKTSRWSRGPDGPGTLCNKCGKRFLRGRLLAKDTVRQCTGCATENTPQWREGPEGPRTLCNACGLVFKKEGHLLPEYPPANSPSFSPLRHSNRYSRALEMHRRNETSATGEMQVELALDAMNSFFSQGSEVSWGEAGAERADEVEEEEELEWLSNKDAFPSVETMAMEVEEEAFSPDVPRARTGGRWRVTAMETTCRQANVPAQGELRAEKETVRRRRCTHCATEKTSLWRDGPEGGRTLCNACGAVFKKNGRLLPEYRPANSPAFSPLLHSNKYSRALEMHHRNETSATGEMQVELMDPPANGPTSSPLERHSSLRRVLEEETSAAGHVAAAEARRGEESMEVQLLPERPPVDSSAFSLVSQNRVLKRRRKSEAQTFAAIRATAKVGRADRAAARLAAMDN